MDLSRESEQRSTFRNLLFLLAKKQDLLQDKQERIRIYKQLEDLYHPPGREERFRHFYSDIFSVLTSLQQDASLGDINILGQNLDIIRKGYQPQEKNGEEINISDNINKLYDHVSLDIARITYSDAGDRRISGAETIETMQAQIHTIKSEIEKTSQYQQETESKISNQQKEYIAILGIFAAVVLAFTGGITFSTSVLNNISGASIYRLIIISLIIGLILLNILFALFFYINNLVNRDKTIKPILISNAVIIGLLCLTVLFWYIGFVESRDAKINQPAFTESTEGR